MNLQKQKKSPSCLSATDRHNDRRNHSPQWKNPARIRHLAKRVISFTFKIQPPPLQSYIQPTYMRHSKALSNPELRLFETETLSLDGSWSHRKGTSASSRLIFEVNIFHLQTLSPKVSGGLRPLLSQFFAAVEVAIVIWRVHTFMFWVWWHQFWSLNGKKMGKFNFRFWTTWNEKQCFNHLHYKLCPSLQMWHLCLIN